MASAFIQSAFPSAGAPVTVPHAPEPSVEEVSANFSPTPALSSRRPADWTVRFGGGAGGRGAADISLAPFGVFPGAPGVPGELISYVNWNLRRTPPVSLGAHPTLSASPAYRGAATGAARGRLFWRCLYKFLRYGGLVRDPRTRLGVRLAFAHVNHATAPLLARRATLYSAVSSLPSKTLRRRLPYLDIFDPDLSHSSPDVFTIQGSLTSVGSWGALGLVNHLSEELRLQLTTEYEGLFDQDDVADRLLFLNAHLIIYSPRRPSSVGCDHLAITSEHKADLAQMRRFKSLYVPEAKTRDDTHCLWECVAAFKQLGGGRGEIDQLSESRKVVSCAVRSSEARTAAREEASAFASAHPDFAAAAEGGDFRVDHDWLPALEAHLGFKVVVFDQDGACTFGDEGSLALLGSLNALILIWFHGHCLLVTSWTGWVYSRGCPACSRRFKTAAAFAAHVRDSECFSCPCGFVADSASDIVEHRAASGGALCAHQSEIRSVGLKQRFLSPPEEAPDRQPPPCVIAFDLETVVPMNSSATPRRDHLPQQPYAAGWVTLEDEARGVKPTIAYGEDCLWTFAQHLIELNERLEGDARERKIESVASALELGTDPKVSSAVGLYLERKKAGNLNHRDAAALYVDGMLLRNGARSLAGEVPVYAHNGGRFDWVFLDRFFMEEGIEVERIRNGGKYIHIKWLCFVFKDTMSICPKSLDSLGKDFGVETCKGIFPYRFMDSLDKICGHYGPDEVLPAHFDLREPVPGPCGLTRSRPMTAEEHSEYFEALGGSFCVRTVTTDYLTADVKCLAQVVRALWSAWDCLPDAPCMYRFDTIGSMVHTYFIENFLIENAYTLYTPAEEDFLRRAMFGGRTEVFARRPSDTNAQIYYYDVNSMYPAVMESEDMPCGTPSWHFTPRHPDLVKIRKVGMGKRKFEQGKKERVAVPSIASVGDLAWVKDALNSGSDSVFGFAEVDVTCPQDLHVPVLPEKFESNGYGKNMFTLTSKTRALYFTEELKFAVARGYVVTKVHAYCELERVKIYADFIDTLKTQKLKGESKNKDGSDFIDPDTGEPIAKNKSLRTAAKLAQNNEYGKTLQRIVDLLLLTSDREKVAELLDNSEYQNVKLKPLFRVSRSAGPGGDVDADPEGFDVVELTAELGVPQVSRRSSCGIGLAILAYARMMLYTYMEKMVAVDGELLYCDTDSIVYAGYSPLPDEDIDPVAYGLMKLEIDPNLIQPGGFVGAGPKSYAMDLVGEGERYVKCKGVDVGNNLGDGAEPLEGEGGDALELHGTSFDNYVRMVENPGSVLDATNLQFQRTGDYHMTAVTVNKCMRFPFDKRRLNQDGLRSSAWNDSHLEEMESLGLVSADLAAARKSGRGAGAGEEPPLVGGARDE